MKKVDFKYIELKITIKKLNIIRVNRITRQLLIQFFKSLKFKINNLLVKEILSTLKPSTFLLLNSENVSCNSIRFSRKSFKTTYYIEIHLLKNHSKKC